MSANMSQLGTMVVCTLCLNIFSLDLVIRLVQAEVWTDVLIQQSKKNVKAVKVTESQ